MITGILKVLRFAMLILLAGMPLAGFAQMTPIGPFLKSGTSSVPGVSFSATNGVLSLSGTPSMSGSSSQSGSAATSGTSAYAVITSGQILPVQTGLQLWLKADAVTGVADTNPFTTWPDSSGNGRDATSGTNSWRPFYYSTGGPNETPTIKFSATSQMSTPAFLDSSYDKSITMFHVYSYPTPGIGTGVAYSCAVTGNAYGMWVGKVGVIEQFPWSQGAMYIACSDADRDFAVECVTYDGTNCVARKNGIQVLTAGATATNKFTGSITLGRDSATSPSYTFNGGNISELLIYNRVLSRSEIASVEAYLSVKYRIAGKQAIVFRGDSLTYGTNATAVSYPVRVMTLLGGTTAAVSVVKGHPGEPLANIIGKSDDLINETLFPKPRIVCVWECTNDMQDTSLTGTDCYARVLAYCKARKYSGDRVVIGTMMPFGTGTNTAIWESHRQQYNTLIRANWPTFADGLADVGADPIMGAPGGQTNATYFSASDQTHPTDAGYTIAGNIWAAAIQGVLTKFGGNVTVLQGNTLTFISGSNGSVGSVTLTSGTANVSNTLIGANDEVFFALKTPSGTVAIAPYVSAVTSGTSFSVTAGASDNSTYRYFILKTSGTTGL